jgi:hypothetical protein
MYFSDEERKPKLTFQEKVELKRQQKEAEY